MKLKTIALLSLIFVIACSQQEENKASATAPKSDVPVPTLENAKATLDASKQIEQTTLNAAEQQRQLLEKTEEGR